MLPAKDGGKVRKLKTAAGHLSDDERIEWLRLIRCDHVGARGIMAQTPPT
jgi:hypothetical protein